MYYDKSTESETPRRVSSCVSSSREWEVYGRRLLGLGGLGSDESVKYKEL